MNIYLESPNLENSKYIFIILISLILKKLGISWKTRRVTQPNPLGFQGWVRVLFLPHYPTRGRVLTLLGYPKPNPCSSLSDKECLI